MWNHSLIKTSIILSYPKQFTSIYVRKNSFLQQKKKNEKPEHIL